ncbi:hypothetical protein [Paenibacillus senegalensis]|uniref:hypothetical protein n=1 Tax=Paenibacillus senegalensis TaxID=1465766 RepID=UPI0002899F8C|nr:hypothetical protein [Paenibacillus senegalensis]
MILLESLIVAVVIFAGWVLFDWFKSKKLSRESLAQSAFIGFLGALVWLILGLLLP